MSAAGGVRAGAPQIVAVQDLWSADLGDRGHGLAPDAAAADGVVLGRLLGDDAHAGAVGGPAATATRHQLRNGVGPAAQTETGDGEPRPGSVEGQGRGRRNLPGRSRGRPEGGPPTLGEGVDRGRGRSARDGRRPSAPAGRPGCLGSRADGLREARRRARHPHPDGWLGGLRAAVGHGLPASPPHTGHARASGEAPAAHPPGVRQPQDLAWRHPPRRRSRSPPSLPGRVRLPLQPAAHPDGSVPDPAGSRLRRPWPHDLRHVVPFGVNPIGRRGLIFYPVAGISEHEEFALSRRGDATRTRRGLVDPLAVRTTPSPLLSARMSTPRCRTTPRARSAGSQNADRRRLTDHDRRDKIRHFRLIEESRVLTNGGATTMVNQPRLERRVRFDRRSFLRTALTAGAMASVGVPGQEAGAQARGTITITSYGGPWEEFMRSAVVPAFEKEHPGVKVELAIGLSKDWVAKLKAAGKDNPPYDIVITNEVWAAPLRAEGRYTKLPPELVPNLKSVAPNLRIKDDMGVLALAGPIGLAYRIDKIKTVPKAWKDLWTVPEYKGKIGIYNIVNSAGQMTICLTSKIWTGGDKDIDTACRQKC